MTDRIRVVVVGAVPDSPPPGIGALADAVDVSFADSVEAVGEALPGAEVVLAWRPRSALLEPVWDRADELEWIQSSSAGVEDLLFPALVDSHVILTNARGVFDGGMAEYVLGLILMFSKGFPGMLERQRRRVWDPRDSEPAAGKRVLVVGVGSIGHAIGRTCSAVGMTVRGVGSEPRPGDEVFGRVIGPDGLAEACRWADYVVDVLPATAGTRHLFDDEVFGAMRPSTRFVNVGRGSTVDQSALVRAIREERLAGAALDVFEEEPLPEDSPLWELPNVIVSPHASGGAAGSREQLVELFVENLQRYLTGRPMKNVVDKERGYVPS